MGKAIPGMGIEFYVSTVSPYPVRLRFKNVPVSTTLGDTTTSKQADLASFEWQMDITLADFCTMIQALMNGQTLNVNSATPATIITALETAIGGAAAAAATSPVSASGLNYTIPNATYPNEKPMYAGSLAPQDLIY